MIQPPLPGFLPKSGWKERPFPLFPPGQPVAIDTETCDPGLKTHGPGGWRRDGFIVGLSVACGNETYYTPVGKQGLREWLKATANSASCLIFANALYDLEWIESGLGIDLSGHSFHDVQVAEPLLDEDRDSYSLDALAMQYLGIGKDEKLLDEAMSAYGFKGKDELWKLPHEYIGPYAEADVRRTLDIWTKQMDILTSEGLMPIYDLERRVTPCLHRMRRKGVKVDMDAVTKLRQELSSQENLLQRELGDLNIASAKEMQRWCDYNSIPYGYTENGNPSFAKAWIETSTHPLVAKVRDLRAIRKIRSDFVDAAILGSADSKGIIRCSWHQMRDPDGGAMTGRMSASKPNIQQVPARSAIGKQVRKCFITPGGGQWLKLDYSQQEPRLMTHFACLTKMPGAKEVADLYREGGDIYKYIMQTTGLDRDQSKTVTLGIMYGMGDELLGEKLHISKMEASDVRVKLYRNVPFLQKLSEDVSATAQKRGYIRTLLGRRQRFNSWEPAYAEKGLVPMRGLERARAVWPDRGLRRAYVHTALNKLIQGSAADMIKKAMTQMTCDMMIAVHDEIGAEIHDPAEADVIKKTAEECVKLMLPVRADVKIGRSWGG